MIKIEQLRVELSIIARATVYALDTHPIAKKLVGGTLSFAEYDYYLAQVSHQIQGTSAMLAAAGARLEELGRPLLGGLFGRKAGEEDHDAWPSRDRAVLAGPGIEVIAIPPSSAVLGYRSFTWFLANDEPVSLLGVAYVLETLGQERAGQAAENLIEKSGIAHISNAVRFLRGHGEVDHDHMRALEIALEDVRSREEAEKIVLAARVTAWMYLAFFQRPNAAIEA